MSSMPGPRAMTDSTDARAVRTRDKLIDAYWELSERTPADEVTVSALTAAAGVHRSVFYKHFATTDALAIYMLTDLFGMLSNSDMIMRGELAATGAGASRAAMTELVRFVGAHRPVYAALLGPAAPAGARQAVIEEFTYRTALALEEMADRPHDVDPHATARFLAHGVIGLVGHWLAEPAQPQTAQPTQESPPTQTEAQIVEQLLQCFPAWLTSSSSSLSSSSYSSAPQAPPPQ